MLYRVAADIVVIIHLGFIVFVFAGGLLALRWRRVILLHLPAAAWGALVEFRHWLCPLTPLENWLRSRGGDLGYEGGFVDHYIVPVVYPPGLTHRGQVVLGCLVLAINIGVYAWLVRRAVRRRGAGPAAGSDRRV